VAKCREAFYPEILTLKTNFISLQGGKILRVYNAFWDVEGACGKA